jgi:hypothetical protein
VGKTTTNVSRHFFSTKFWGWVVCAWMVVVAYVQLLAGRGTAPASTINNHPFSPFFALVARPPPQQGRGRVED